MGIKCILEYVQVLVITLVSLLFITMIPIDCKITNFSLYLFVCFFREITIIISWHVFVGSIERK